MSNPDIIVAGAGHNSLITAAYLAAAGQTVLVLEGQNVPGGDTMTQELTLPGFHHDSCSTAHTLIQSNPLLQRNELQLDRFGLRYLQPDPVLLMPFRDGESVTIFRDVEKTVEGIRHFSESDARAYVDLLSEWDRLKPLLAAERNAPPLQPWEADDAWSSGPLGPRALRIRKASGLEIILERFENPYIQAALGWLATLTLQAINLQGTGVLPFSLTAGRQRNGWAIPAGGSGALPAALIRVIEANGGDVRCGSWVRHVLVEDGRAVGVVTDEGEYRAGRAVISTAHIKQLPRLLGNELDTESRKSIDEWQPGLTMFVSHYALDEAPKYRHQGQEMPVVAMGAIESLDNLMAMLEDFERGKLHLKQPFLLCLSPTIVDPSRAPAGMHTLKVISKQPYDLEEGPDAWDEIKEDVSQQILETYLSYTSNLTEKNIMATHVESPLDLERRNPNNFRGSCHGGASIAGQTGWFRPAPGWNQYRTPIDAFYLTGACTHPGGSVSGFPGRNCARTVFDDLGLDWEEALRRVRQLAERRSKTTAVSTQA